MQKRIMTMVAKRGLKFTGLAVLDDRTLAVTTERHLATLSLSPHWEPGNAWPRSFLRAAATTLLIAKFGHRHCAAGTTTGLWSLPRDMVGVIVKHAAGRRTDWLGVPCDCRDGSADEPEWGHDAAYEGLTKEQLVCDLVQAPLCQQHYRADACTLDPACPAPLSYLN